MPDMFNDVRDFHEKFNLLIQSYPAIPPTEITQLRISLILEEVQELGLALSKNDLPQIADGIADLIYVLLGAAISYGINLNTVWTAVHTANMQKVGGGKSLHGKVLKPPGWLHPDIETILERQQLTDGIPLIKEY